MRVGKHLIVALFAFLLYLIVPYGTNWGLTVVCFILFLLISFDLLKEDFKYKNYISFNSIFLVSFFLTTFVFPVFILASDSVLNQFIDLNFLVQFVDFKYLSRGVFLSLLAISIYAAAYQGYKGNHKHIKEGINHRVFRKGTADAWLAFALFVTIFNAFYSLQTFSTTNLQQNAYVYDILKASLVVAFLTRLPSISSQPIGFDNYRFFIKSNLFPIIVSLISILLFLYFGVRNLAISVFLIMMIVMVFYYTKISLKYVLIMAVVGTISLYVIRETRHSDSSIMNSGVSSALAASNTRQTPVLFLFSDLIGACQELSLGVEIKDKTGYQNPEQIALLPFLPFPVLPSLMSDVLWDKTYQEATAASILNEYMLTSANKQATYGKHCVSDLYMKWGVIGIIVFFALLGRIVATTNANKWRNYYSAASLITLVSLSLFLARGSLIDLIRPLSYVCIMVWVFSRKQNVVITK
ncbi:MAG: O-antigen polysaccharide polymerase Wzy [Bacteroidaceae bacterium]|nr:O-antigen polysaccharide polymerase Wzy [Bacteroidaceae bacterium]